MDDNCGCGCGPFVFLGIAAWILSSTIGGSGWAIFLALVLIWIAIRWV